MADVRPFRGLRYFTSETNASLTDVICPPYDVISPSQQQALEERSQHNAVRIELPRGEGLEQYANAAGLFSQWQADGVLIRDDAPCYYLMRHRFSHAGESLERWGLTAAVRLEDYERRVVLPHEFTRAQAKEDRFRLMTACAANLSPVMSLYGDPQKRIRSTIQEMGQRPPTAVATYEGSEDLALWVVSASELNSAVEETLRDAPLFIADGHHRYETALRYRDAMRQEKGNWSEDDAFNFVMMTLIDFDDPGLLVLPYHRALQGVSPSTLTEVRNRLLEVFQIEAIDPQPTTPQALEEAVANTRGVSLGLLGPDGEGPYMLTLRSRQMRDDLAKLPGGGSLRDAEGWVLHATVLEPVLGSAASDSIAYVHDPQEAWGQVLAGRLQMAFFLKPFPMDLFRAVVSTGQRLPPKSTYFHPKLPTGLVFNPLWGEI